MNDTERMDLKQIISKYISHISDIETKILDDSASVNEIESIEAILSHEFARVGLKENDEPNETGMKIESLIDKLTSRR